MTVPVGCQCCATHNPEPTELHNHHIVPLYLGGPDLPENEVLLCPTGHANVHEMIRMMMKVGLLSISQMRDAFPERLNTYLYNLAVRGYKGRPQPVASTPV